MAPPEPRVRVVVSRLRSMIGGDGLHLLDGAMGTLLYERGVFVNVSYDALNLTDPDLVAGIHREYIEAGSEILETNSFGANRVRLSGFGLEERVREINLRAAEIARDAAGATAAVLGSIGPLGLGLAPSGPASEPEVREYFREQAESLAEGDVDGFALETFAELHELDAALGAVRSFSDLPVFAQVTFGTEGLTSDGHDVETVARRLGESGAEVIGANCSAGPPEMLEVVRRMAAVTATPLVAQPNAGLPQLVGGRRMYLSTPSFFARYAERMADAGARFLGGCCGTGPEHIRAVSAR